MSEQVRLGIIGYGVQGSIYARMVKAGLAPSIKIAAVADIDEGARSKAATDNPQAAIYDSFEALLGDGNIDAIITTTPHYTHPSMGIQAFRAGKHVLIDKPAGVYSQQVDFLIEEARKHPELRFAMMFNQRTNPLYQKVKEIVDSGQIGAIRRSNWIITNWWRPQTYHDQSQWRATWGGEGGGVLVNQAPHQLDMWQWICGKPASVYAKIGYGFRRNIAVEDEVTILADYGDGVTGTFITATHDVIGTDRFEILGDRGRIVVDESKTATVWTLTDDEQTLSESFDVAIMKELLEGKIDRSMFYRQESFSSESKWGLQHSAVLENFGRSILHGEPLIAQGEEGIVGVQLANAAHLSSWLGKEVPYDYDRELYAQELNNRIRAEGKYNEIDFSAP